MVIHDRPASLQVALKCMLLISWTHKLIGCICRRGTRLARGMLGSADALWNATSAMPRLTTVNVLPLLACRLSCASDPGVQTGRELDSDGAQKEGMLSGRKVGKFPRDPNRSRDALASAHRCIHSLEPPRVVKEGCRHARVDSQPVCAHGRRTSSIARHWLLQARSEGQGHQGCMTLPARVLRVARIELCTLPSTSQGADAVRGWTVSFSSTQVGFMQW